MDKERQIRFLYPPLILLGALISGLYIDENTKLNLIVAQLNIDDTKDIIAVIIGGGASVLVIGYVIGAITITCLRIWYLRNKGTYEFNYNQDFGDISEVVLQDKHGPIENSEKLYAFVTYDHEFLPQNIHLWIQSRWNTFHTSANVVTSLTLSAFIALFIGICSLIWWVLHAALIIIYTYHGYRVRKETLGMINFQTKVRSKEKSH
jgi:hypothetical protein